MGSVLCTYKIIPNAIENFNVVKAEVAKMEPHKLEEEPLAFGLNLVKATFVVPEEDGKLDELEEKLNSIRNVESVELAHMTRSL